MQDTLGNRMKDFYENRAKTKLTRKIPVLMRVDGKSFHTFCKRFKKPYDPLLHSCLNEVMVQLCKNIQGAKFAERHSDEISILITDFDKATTDAYFDYEVQKMVSVAAGIATAEFCRQLIIRGEVEYKINPDLDSMAFVGCGASWGDDTEWVCKLNMKPLSFEEEWPTFDCRCHNLPEEEIGNYFWWRLIDARRNSVNMLAQSKFPHAKLQGVTSNQMQEMLFQEFDINWNDLQQAQKAGYCCYRSKVNSPIEKGPRKGQVVERSKWIVSPSSSNKLDLDTVLSCIPLRKEA